MDLGEFTYLELIGPGSKRRGFESAIHKVDPVEREHVVLEPHHDAFEERTGDTGGWALGSFGVGAVLWLFMLAIPGVHGAKLRQLADGSQAAQPRELGWRAFLVPSRANFGTAVLAYLNVVVFLVMVFAGLGVVGFHLDDLVKWGACSRPLLHGVGVIRLVTSQFVHDGLMHLAGNLYGLLFAGLMLESFIGGRRVLVAYLIAGVIGGLASALVHPAAVTMGASGSIFGLFGVLIGLLLVKDERVAADRNFLLVNAGIYVGLNLLLGAVSPGIANTAHVGGLLVGFIMVPLLRIRSGATAGKEQTSG
jgi:rhomboid protease GluP